MARLVTITTMKERKRGVLQGVPGVPGQEGVDRINSGTLIRALVRRYGDKLPSTGFAVSKTRCAAG
jgi:hypothetical protein